MIERNTTSEGMKKYRVLLLFVALGPIIGGLYGILHDQLTYTISPEYYFKFKFYQFGILTENTKVILPFPRIQVSMVGFLATWWMGMPICLILALAGLVHKTHKQMLRAVTRAIFVTINIAFCTGLIGLAYGKMHYADYKPKWWFPENLIDEKSFIAVGYMHNFSYLGGLIGLVGGVITILVLKKISKEAVLN